VPGPLAVTFLFNRTCPSHEEGLRLLHEAAARAGREVDVTVREVTDDEEAASLGFPGSPTYLVEGRDIAPVVQGASYAAEACRVYRLRGGRFGPLPHIDDLVRVLTEAQQKEEAA
jgi:hypothetical protein